MSENYNPAPVVALHEAVHSVVDRVRGLTRRQIAGAVVAGSLVLGACSSDEAISSSPESTTAGTTPGTEVVDTSSTAPELCADTWQIVQVDPGENNRLMADGLESIKTAETEEDARNAAFEWVAIVKTDSDLLAGAAKGILEVDVTSAELQDAEGLCATPRAKELATALEAKLGMSTIVPSEAPANGINTGTDESGAVVSADSMGIGGDRKSIEITTMEGDKYHILGRCSNIVFVHDQPPVLIPMGPTDNPLFPPEVVIPRKTDDGVLPGDPNVPADQQPGTPDVPGQGPAGQQPGPDGYLPTETRPTVPQSPNTTVAPTTPPNTTPATTNPRPTSTTAVTITLPTPTTARFLSLDT